MRELTPAEARKANREILGIPDELQSQIASIESGATDGDLVELDEQGHRVSRKPQPAEWML